MNTKYNVYCILLVIFLLVPNILSAQTSETLSSKDTLVVL